MWIAVRQRFTQFHSDLMLTPTQRLDGLTKGTGVVKFLNRHYYDSVSELDNSFKIGSWGKDTAVRPPRDVDLYFLLPPAVYATIVRSRQPAGMVPCLPHCTSTVGCPLEALACLTAALGALSIRPWK